MQWEQGRGREGEGEVHVYVYGERETGTEGEVATELRWKEGSHSNRSIYDIRTSQG